MGKIYTVEFIETINAEHVLEYVTASAGRAHLFGILTSDKYDVALNACYDKRKELTP